MHKKIVILGVSGSGKSLIGSRLAQQLGYDFFDGDDYHSQSNIEKMRLGTPLNDEDRQDWLSSLNQLLKTVPNGVLACSGLTPAHRMLLQQGVNSLAMLYLKSDFATIWKRHQQRQGHYFQGQEMLKSQFDTLIEPTPDDAYILDASQNADIVLQQALAYLKQAP